ncbi:MAG: hypothetical protein AAFW46_08095, partial [Pseudomonadota bacterium]
DLADLEHSRPVTLTRRATEPLDRFLRVVKPAAFVDGATQSVSNLILRDWIAYFRCIDIFLINDFVFGNIDAFDANGDATGQKGGDDRHDGEASP